MIKQNILKLAAFAAVLAFSFSLSAAPGEAPATDKIDVHGGSPGAAATPNAAIPDIAADPTYKKVKEDLESSKETVAQLQQLIQTIQSQRDSFSKAFLDAQAQISLLQSELATVKKEIEDPKKSAATSTSAATSK